MRELSVTKQRYQAVQAVIDDGRTVTEVAKDWLVIRGGFNVFPRDVEDALLEHPDAALAGGVGRPDKRSGEEVVAFVSLKTRQQGGGGGAGPQSVAKNGCPDNHYPRGKGLATSPSRRARLRFHSVVLRVRRRRSGLA
jgi:acyl-CoA synthetase (AMP-forming)/AMP-acid ligase II